MLQLKQSKQPKTVSFYQKFTGNYEEEESLLNITKDHDLEVSQEKEMKAHLSLIEKSIKQTQKNVGDIKTWIIFKYIDMYFMKKL